MKVVKVTKKNGVKNTYHVIVEVNQKELENSMFGTMDWGVYATSPGPKIPSPTFAEIEASYLTMSTA